MTSLLEAHRQKLIYQATLLGAACFLVSILLLMGNLATQPFIASHVLNDRKMMLEEVLPPSAYDNDPLAETYKVEDSPLFNKPVTLFVARRNGIINGAGIQATVQGWGGEIDYILAVDANGEITGVRIISHKETPGLADKIEIDKDDWITGFNGKSLANTAPANWRVKKDQGEFDQFTGATITPRAVVGGVYGALQVYDQWRRKQILKPAAPEER